MRREFRRVVFTEAAKILASHVAACAIKSRVCAARICQGSEGREPARCTFYLLFHFSTFQLFHFIRVSQFRLENLIPGELRQLKTRDSHINERT